MSLTKRKTSSGGSTYWALSTLNLYSPTTYSVTVGEDSTSHDTFTVNTKGLFGNGMSLNYIPAGQGGIDTYTTLMLHLNNNVTDSSSNAYTVTNTNVTFSNSSPNFTGTYYGIYNGTNSSLVVTTASVPFIGTNDGTIDFWFYPTSVVGSAVLWIIQASGGNFSFLEIGPSLNINWNQYISGSLQYTYNSANNVLVLNTWQHIALVRHSNVWKIYVNGVSVASGADAGSFPTGYTNLTIGNDSSNDTCACRIQEFRQSSIARWTANFTPPAAPYDSMSVVGVPSLSFLSSSNVKAKIWTDGNNGDRLTFSVGGTDYATLTSTGVATFTGQLIGKGTATNDSAATGYIGEYVTASLASGSATSLTNVTAKTVTSISLTAGDWDVTGIIDFHPDTTTTTTYLRAGISTTNNTLGAADTYSTNPFAIAVTSVDAAEITPTVRITLTTTTTVYLIAMAGFAISTLTAYGTIRARRMR